MVILNLLIYYLMMSMNQKSLTMEFSNSYSSRNSQQNPKFSMY